MKLLTVLAIFALISCGNESEVNNPTAQTTPVVTEDALDTVEESIDDTVVETTEIPGLTLEDGTVDTSVDTSINTVDPIVGTTVDPIVDTTVDPIIDTSVDPIVTDNNATLGNGLILSLLGLPQDASLLGYINQALGGQTAAVFPGTTSQSNQICNTICSLNAQTSQGPLANLRASIRQPLCGC